MKRLVVGLVVLVGTFLPGALVHKADAAPARPPALPGLPSPCDLAPVPIIADACNAANDPVGTGIGIVAGGVDAATGGAASGFFDQGLSWVAGILADTVKGALDSLGGMLSSAPKAPIDQPWFLNEYWLLVSTGIGLSVIVCFVHLWGNAIRWRTWEMGRTFQLFCLAAFGVATGPLWMGALLSIADAFTAAFASVGGEQAGQLSDKLTETTSSITNTGGLDGVKPVLLVIVLLVAVVMVLFWMLLLALRSNLIYIGTLAIPFVLPSIIDGKMRFARLFFKTMLGIILAEPILVGVLSFGALLLRDGYVGQNGLYPLLTGIALIGCATFLPFAVLKIFGLATPAVQVIERAGKSVVNVARTGAQKATVLAAGAVTGGAAIPLAAATGSPRQPPPRPTPAAEPPAPTRTAPAPPAPSGDDVWTTTPSRPSATSPASEAVASSSD